MQPIKSCLVSVPAVALPSLSLLWNSRLRRSASYRSCPARLRASKRSAPPGSFLATSRSLSGLPFFLDPLLFILGGPVQLYPWWPGTAKKPNDSVGVAGFEPATPASRTQCSTGLSHTPTRTRLIALGFAHRKKPNRGFNPGECGPENPDFARRRGCRGRGGALPGGGRPGRVPDRDGLWPRRRRHQCRRGRAALSGQGPAVLQSADRPCRRPRRRAADRPFRCPGAARWPRRSGRDR